MNQIKQTIKQNYELLYQFSPKSSSIQSSFKGELVSPFGFNIAYVGQDGNIDIIESTNEARFN